jgi:hypothetical protein
MPTPTPDPAMELLSLLSLNPAPVTLLCDDLHMSAGKLMRLVDDLHGRGYVVVKDYPFGANNSCRGLFLSPCGVVKARADAEKYVDELDGKWN